MATTKQNINEQVKVAKNNSERGEKSEPNQETSQRNISTPDRSQTAAIMDTDKA